ncbi:hypothetical protein [Baaleninema sp.]|uniref:hypothetical protein n=1 Tax=Baaleninema sp. TaxID=3101197 RepID=UPI003D04C262
MLDRSSDTRIPAPCIIETGLIVNKRDMQRVLGDLHQVRYLYLQDGEPHSRGEAYVVEVFSDPQQSTILANRSLYLNVASFDYLELKRGDGANTYFDLVQESRQLRLIPVTSPLVDRSESEFSDDTLESVLAQVISAKLDAQIDDLDDFYREE